MYTMDVVVYIFSENYSFILFIFLFAFIFQFPIFLCSVAYFAIPRLKELF